MIYGDRLGAGRMHVAATCVVSFCSFFFSHADELVYSDSVVESSTLKIGENTTVVVRGLGIISGTIRPPEAKILVGVSYKRGVIPHLLMIVL